MLVTTKVGTIDMPPGSIIVGESETQVVVILRSPQTCRTCKREAMMFINELGHTRCPSCPREEQQK